MPENRKLPTRLDPRRPLVLDSRDLGRRPGSMSRRRFAAPAPAGLGLDLVGVPAGGELELDLRLESVMEGVLVSGTVSGPLAGQCARCLDPFDARIEVDLQELYAYPDSSTDLTTEDDEVRRIDGDHIDLEPSLRDAVVLALPLRPLCREDCPGLCATCGERLDESGDHAHDSGDLRWAVLERLYAEDKSTLIPGAHSAADGQTHSSSLSSTTHSSPQSQEQ